MKAREARLPLARIEEDRIIAHGVVCSELVIELDFEVISVQRVKVNGSNSTSIETAIDKARPPAVWDVQAEAIPSRWECVGRRWEALVCCVRM